MIAEIMGFPPDYSLLVNGRPTYQVECKYVDPLTQTPYIFLSQNIARNPFRINQKTVRVYTVRDCG